MSQAVLVVSARLDGARATALRALWGDAVLDVVAPGALPDLSRYRAMVLDGVPEPAEVGSWVKTGGSVLCLPLDCGLRGEWIARVVARDHPATARLPREMSITDHFTPLASAGEVVVSVSMAFRNEPAVTTMVLGEGQITTCGLASALSHPDLARLLRRLVLRTSSARKALGLGIVGYGPYGGMGQRHGAAAAAIDGLELVAACDSDPARRKAAEADFPGLVAHPSLEEMLGDENVSVVIVATPPTSHAALARSALLAGRHVALEKPMCLTLAEAHSLIGLAARAGLTLTVNQNRRWDPDYRAARRVVDAGLLGELFAVESFVGSFEHPCRAWHSEESVSGGAVYDWGSHYLDWSLQLMGSPPATVTAHAHKRVWRDVTNADQIRVHLAWEDGREAIFIQSDVAAIRKPKLYLQGTAGTLAGHYRPVVSEWIDPTRGYLCDRAHHAEAPVDLVLARYEAGWGLTETRLAPMPALEHPFHRNLADHLLLSEPLAVTPESVSPVIAVLEAATTSAASGGTPVRLGEL